jgi:hypothetical protein
MAIEPENKTFRNLELSNDIIQTKTDELGMFIGSEIAEPLQKGCFSICVLMTAMM